MWNSQRKIQESLRNPTAASYMSGRGRWLCLRRESEEIKSNEFKNPKFPIISSTEFCDNELLEASEIQKAANCLDKKGLAIFSITPELVAVFSFEGTRKSRAPELLVADTQPLDKFQKHEWHDNSY